LNQPAVKASGFTFISLMTAPMPENPQYPEIVKPELIEFLPREERMGKQTASFILTESDFNSLKQKKAWLYVYGFADYIDERGKPYRTKFCAEYIPATGKIRLCPAHNTVT
jgi:hypothetical protein